MTNKKSSTKGDATTSAAKELEAKRRAAAKLEKEEKVKREEYAAQIQTEMEAMNLNPRLTIREVFDPAGNLIQKEMEVGPRDASLIEFDQDSKGMVKPRIKIYHEDPQKAFEIALDLMKKAVKEAVKMSL